MLFFYKGFREELKMNWKSCTSVAFCILTLLSADVETNQMTHHRVQQQRPRPPAQIIWKSKKRLKKRKRLSLKKQNLSSKNGAIIFAV